MPKPTSLPATVATDSSTETLPTRAAKDASAAGASAGIQPVGDSSTEVILRHWREAVPNDRFAHLVKDATRSFQRSLQMRLARFDVPFGHWTFLRALWERDGLTQKQLSDEVGVMEPTTLMAVRAMEARGWVERRQRAENRKNVHVYLTDAGRALKDVLVPLAEEVNASGAKGLTADEIAVARRVLLTMITNLAEDATGRE
ncbi:MarR family winged helix-turn-helix transcriptional regulator [Casimicrobium huifangae]|uniref:MarR family winged helix-turn-helix transcriptional regulator n=1 Tax=Casimicrobium huifangae TaxID=2591109 RepID=UPI0037843D46